MITDHWPSVGVRRVQFFTALCASAAVALSGCGGSPSPQDPSQVRVLDVVSLLPPDAEGVIVVDVATVRSAPFMARVDEALEPYMNAQSTNVRELLNRIDRVAVAFRHEPTDEGGEPLLIVMRGSFRASDLQTFAASQTPGTHREHELRRDGPTVLALASDHTLMFGSDHWVLAALDRLDGLSPPAGPSSAVLVDAAQRVELGQHTVTYASTVPHDFGLNGLFPVQGNAVSLGAWVDLGESIRMQGFGLFTDDATAAAMATAMREKIAEGQQSPELQAAGFDQLFASANIVANGPVVDVTYSLDSETFERVIIAMLSGFQAFTAASEAAVEEPAGGEGPQGPPATDMFTHP
ncbi:MAG: hypothetical protein IPH72_02525 [Sandaracinaceae bacterium]|nr:hypothetical protein [Sandaracinaceae bacterium]